MADTLKVERREQHGKKNNRRLRRSGTIPAVLYGHGQEVISLSVPSATVEAALRHGGRIVTLEGAVADTAFIREVQWDTYGLEVLHVDFTRVSQDEKVRVRVPVELRGEAPGVKLGGVVQHLLHEIEIDCPVVALPEKLFLSINSLQLDEHKTLGDVELPQGAELHGDAERVVVQCVVPTEAPEEVEGAGQVEPELIGRKAAEEEEEE